MYVRRLWDYLGFPGNNLVCDCNALWLWRFLNTSNIISSITCTKPDSLTGQLLTSIQETDLQCGKTSYQYL